MKRWLAWLVALAWLSFAWASARAPSFGPPMKYIRVFDAALALAWVTFAWRSYSHHRAMLRERAFEALAGPPPPARSEVLRRGSRGVRVVAWKHRLRQLGYDVSLDDVFDEQTEAATAAYQQQLGVEADGIVGAKTWFKIPWKRR